MHHQGLFHRDLKPENILEFDNTIKLADFGLAKETSCKTALTDYVSTRWYRAPEVILRSGFYGKPVDVFAMGTIMVELYNGCPIFPGESETDQINKILQVMGTPDRQEWPDGYKLAK
jgi:protein kinase